MDSVIWTAIIGSTATIGGAGLVAWQAAKTQIKRWQEAEKKLAQSQATESDANATKSFAEAANDMAKMANGLTEELTKIYARLASVEDDNRQKGDRIAELLQEQEKNSRERLEQAQKIVDQENRIIDLASRVGTWQGNYQRLESELKDVREWAQSLVQQVLDLGGVPKKYVRRDQPGVIV
jgi:chromosome segregation ATPase